MAGESFFIEIFDLSLDSAQNIGRTVLRRRTR